MRTLRDWLAETPFTLVMSSGFFGFFAHAGVVSVLEEQGLRPARVAGSSAGALVGALWGAGIPAARIREELLGLRREHFWDLWPGLGLLRGRLFRARLERVLPVRDASRRARCRWPSRCGTSSRAGPWCCRAVRSLRRSTRPVRFRCSSTRCGIGGRLYADGGIADRPGLAGVAEGERVLYHHLTSRSPWRRKGSPALRVPARRGLEAIALDGLPRLGPFRLGLGQEAMERAAEGAREALDRSPPQARAEDARPTG